MKKIFSIFVFFLVSFSAMAAFSPAQHLNPSQPDEIFQWKFDSLNDGMFFLLGPESPHFLMINVHPLTSSGQPSDPVMVYCNASKYRIVAGETLHCYGNYEDVITMTIQPEDFNHGSAGTYTYRSHPNR